MIAWPGHAMQPLRAYTRKERGTAVNSRSVTQQPAPGPGPGYEPRPRPGPAPATATVTPGPDPRPPSGESQGTLFGRARRGRTARPGPAWPGLLDVGAGRERRFERLGFQPRPRPGPSGPADPVSTSHPVGRDIWTTDRGVKARPIYR
jgi:hypothetical protein